MGYINAHMDPFPKRHRLVHNGGFPKLKASYCSLALNRPEGGGIRPQTGSSLCHAETISSRKLKFTDFYYILINFHFEYKTSHGTSIVAMVMLLLKSAWYNIG